MIAYIWALLHRWAYMYDYDYLGGRFDVSTSSAIDRVELQRSLESFSQV